MAFLSWGKRVGWSKPHMYLSSPPVPCFSASEDLDRGALSLLGRMRDGEALLRTYATRALAMLRQLAERMQRLVSKTKRAPIIPKKRSSQQSFFLLGRRRKRSSPAVEQRNGPVKPPLLTLKDTLPPSYSSHW